MDWNGYERGEHQHDTPQHPPTKNHRRLPPWVVGHLPLQRRGDWSRPCWALTLKTLRPAVQSKLAIDWKQLVHRARAYENSSCISCGVKALACFWRLQRSARK